MDILESLKAAGFKPESNTDGEFKALKGTYECTIQTLRPEVDTKNDNAKYYQFELKPSAVLEGDAFGDKFTFRRRIYMDGEKAAENLKKLLNDLFTCGLELNTSSIENMEADFVKAIGLKAYCRAWAWKPEGKDSEVQMFVIQKPGVAEKKRTKDSLTF